jgi:hypothetical protein
MRGDLCARRTTGKRSKLGWPRPPASCTGQTTTIPTAFGLEAATRSSRSVVMQSWPRVYDKKAAQPRGGTDKLVCPWSLARLCASKWLVQAALGRGTRRVCHNFVVPLWLQGLGFFLTRDRAGETKPISGPGRGVGLGTRPRRPDTPVGHGPNTHDFLLQRAAERISLAALFEWIVAKKGWLDRLSAKVVATRTVARRYTASSVTRMVLL